MILHPIEYKEGILFVDKSIELKPGEQGYVFMVSVWRKPIEPKLLHVINRDKNNEYIVKARKVQGDLNHADINGESWATVSVHDCSGVVIAQSLNLSLPNIPYVEIEEDIEQLSKDNQSTFYQKMLQDLGGYSKAHHVANFDNAENPIYGYIAGYKAASAKKYTEEDLKKVIRLSRLSYSEIKEREKYYRDQYTEDEIIHSLQPKIKSIEIQMEGVKEFMSEETFEHLYNMDNAKELWNKYKPFKNFKTYQKDGRTLLKIKSIEYDK